MRGFHTLIRNASFPSPTNVGSHNPPPWRPTSSLTHRLVWLYTICNSPNRSRMRQNISYKGVESLKTTISANGELRLLHIDQIKSRVQQIKKTPCIRDPNSSRTTTRTRTRTNKTKQKCNETYRSKFRRFTLTGSMKLYIKLLHPIINHLHFVIAHHPVKTQKNPSKNSQ